MIVDPYTDGEGGRGLAGLDIPYSDWVRLVCQVTRRHVQSFTVQSADAVTRFLSSIQEQAI
jgi:hypothetical protein